MRKRDELTDPKSCLNRARDDEYVFVLLARDLDAPGTIRDWVRRRITRGKNQPGDEQMQEALLAASRIEAEHGDSGRTDLEPGLYTVISGGFAGALVRLHFINSSGNADCRFAADFGPHRTGEIVVCKQDNLKSAQSN